MSHTYSSLRVHVIFSTKERQKRLREELQPKLCAYIAGIASSCQQKSFFDFPTGTIASTGLWMGERNPHQDRIVHAHNQPRELLLPHFSHGLVAWVKRLHGHAQWGLGVSRHVKAYADIRLPVTIDVD